MTGDLAFAPQIRPLFLASLAMVALAIFVWRRRAVPGARPLVTACLLSSIWAAAAAAEAMAVDPTVKVAWFRFQAVCQLPTVTAITAFVLEYANPGRWLTRRTLILLSIAPLLQLALALTNELHHWHWLGFSAGASVVPLRGPAAYILIAYALCLGLVNLVILAWLFVRSPAHRWPAALMVIGTIAARSLYVLKVAGRGAVLGLDPLLFVMAVPLGTYAIALFGFRILHPIAMAGQAVLAQMREGVLVLDSEGRVASLNPAGERILRLPARQAIGRPAGELLPAYPAGLLADPAGAEIEISLPEGGPDARQYVMAISPLKDWRESEVGRLLLLRDVTEQKRAQAQIVEQQRALATLQERDRLARELHDGIGQVLGYVKMQAQAARDRLAQDQLAATDAGLAQLVAVAQDAHADVREYILGAKGSAGAPPGFVAALRQYLERFSRQYGLQAELAAPPEGIDDLVAPTAAAQLLRITQEALTNARKHANARRAQVSVQLVGDKVQVTVADDGVGFDPALLATAEGHKYGLGFMRERAQEVGGSVEIRSAPGAGTQVLVTVPRRKEQP